MKHSIFSRFRLSQRAGRVLLANALGCSLIGCSWLPRTETDAPMFSHSDPKEPARIPFTPAGPTQWLAVAPIEASEMPLIAPPRQIAALTLLFPSNLDVVQPVDRARLQQWVKGLPSSDLGRLKISGHTDSVMNEAYNQDLSQRRVNAVAELLKNMGLDADRFNLEAHSKRLPQASNQDESGRALNRRVVLEWLPS
jgi:OmpA-OmpF porin, OOP family